MQNDKGCTLPAQMCARGGCKVEICTHTCVCLYCLAACQRFPGQVVLVCLDCELRAPQPLVSGSLHVLCACGHLTLGRNGLGRRLRTGDQTHTPTLVNGCTGRYRGMRTWRQCRHTCVQACSVKPARGWACVIQSMAHHTPPLTCLILIASWVISSVTRSKSFSGSCNIDTRQWPGMLSQGTAGHDDGRKKPSRLLCLQESSGLPQRSPQAGPRTPAGTAFGTRTLVDAGSLCGSVTDANRRCRAMCASNRHSVCNLP